MRKILAFLLLIVCTTGSFTKTCKAEETMSVETAFVSLIHMVKNEDIMKNFYKEYANEKKQNGKVSAETEKTKKLLECYGEAFKDMSESEILEKLTLAWEYDIPQYDIALRVAKCTDIFKE